MRNELDRLLLRGVGNAEGTDGGGIVACIVRNTELNGVLTGGEGVVRRSDDAVRIGTGELDAVDEHLGGIRVQSREIIFGGVIRNTSGELKLIITVGNIAVS